MKQEYLGDGVYALWDGYQVELRANNYDDPTDKVWLEPSVLAALNRFYNKRVDRHCTPNCSCADTPCSCLF